VPGIQKQICGKIQTFLDEKPYMLSANMTWLFPNTTRKPLDDAAFRKALAHAIDLDRIVSADYGGIVEKADPTGLLPIWDEFIDDDVVADKGFTYDIAKAKQMLADAGYEDWMTAIQIISRSTKAAGIRITPATPGYDTLVEDRGLGRYDMVLANDRQISNTPWSYYDYIYRLPIQENQTTVNYERFTDRALTRQLDKTPSDDTEAMTGILSQLQSRFLDDMPAIPLWYNGLWAQWNTGRWSGWPSEGGNEALPSMWRDYLQMTGMDMITHLQPPAQ
jgi:peptide/nickel transport system substrate-binding protein